MVVAASLHGVGRRFNPYRMYQALLVKWYNDGFVIRNWQFDSVKGHQINISMKELLKSLPQLLAAMPELVKYIKYIPVLMILAGIGFGAWYFVENRKDPYKCVNNHVFEQLRIDSDVYVFKGGTCIDANDLKTVDSTQ